MVDAAEQELLESENARRISVMPIAREKREVCPSAQKKHIRMCHKGNIL